MSRRRNNQSQSQSQLHSQSQSNLASNLNNQLALRSNTNHNSNNQLALVSNYNTNNYVVNETKKKDTFTIKVKDNPSVEDLKELLKDEKFCFRFNNINKSAYIECHKDANYYIDYYKTFGKPQIYGLYEKNNTTKFKELIGTITLINRYDNNIGQIMDLKIKKKNRGNGGVSKFVLATLINRLFKYNGYYGICMNTNTVIEYLTSRFIMPKLINRGKMLLYLVSFEELNKILIMLSSFYCSEIGFIDNSKSRLIIDVGTKKPYKLLHLHHNADYREDIDYIIPQRGYQYCFSIYEKDEFIIQELKENYKITSSSNATIYSSDFTPNWSKFVKTYEI